MELFKLFGSVLIDDKDAINTLNKVDKKGKTTGQKFADVAKKGALIGAAVVGGTVAAGGALLGMANKAAAVADNVDKASQKMGVSTDAYQEMDFWASQNGISQGDMEKALGRLNQRIGEAKDGNEKYSGALEKLGVNMKDVEDGTVSTEDAMYQSISALSEMTNEQDKAAMASELFGTKLGRELMPALQDGSLSLEDAKKKAHELGIVLDEESVAAGVKFTDSMDQMKRSLSGIVTKIGVEVMPIVQQALEWVTAHMPQIQAVASRVFQVIGDVMTVVIGIVRDYLVPAFKFMVDWVTANMPMIKMVIKTVIDTVMSIINSFVALATAIWSRWGNQIIIVATTAFNIMKNVVGGIIKAVQAIIKVVTSAINGDWRGVWDGIKNYFSAVWGTIKAVAGNLVSGLKQIITSKISETVSKVKNKFNEVYDAIMKPINKAKSAVSTAIEAMKGFFNFNWKLPKIKMPSFSVSGSKNPVDWLKEGVPKLSVNWNAKGGIFDKPTIFNTNAGLQGVGEAGPEAILPLNSKTYDGIGEGIAKSLSSMLNQQPVQSNDNRPIILQIDGKTFAEITGDYFGTEGATRINNIERGLA